MKLTIKPELAKTLKKEVYNTKYKLWLLQEIWLIRGNLLGFAKEYGNSDDGGVILWDEASKKFDAVKRLLGYDDDLFIDRFIENGEDMLRSCHKITTFCNYFMS